MKRAFQEQKLSYSFVILSWTLQFSWLALDFVKLRYDSNFLILKLLISCLNPYLKIFLWYFPILLLEIQSFHSSLSAFPHYHAISFLVLHKLDTWIGNLLLRTFLLKMTAFLSIIHHFRINESIDFWILKNLNPSLGECCLFILTHSHSGFHSSF